LAGENIDTVDGRISDVRDEEGSDRSIMRVRRPPIKCESPGLVKKRIGDGYQNMPSGGEDLYIVPGDVGDPYVTRKRVEGLSMGSLRARVCPCLEEGARTSLCGNTGALQWRLAYKYPCVVCDALEKSAIRGYSKIGTCGRALHLVNLCQVVFTSFQTLHGYGTVSVLAEDSGCEISGAFEGAKL
jgi:hypothetical protein